MESAGAAPASSGADTSTEPTEGTRMRHTHATPERPAPDEDWMSGYPQEIQDFMECVAYDREPKCGALLAVDTVAVMYAAYLSAERHGTEVEVPR